MTAYDVYNWCETKPGVWQREADEAEIFHTTCIKFLQPETGERAINILFHVSLTVPVPEETDFDATSELFDESIHIAWARLRHDMPGLSTYAVFDVANQKWLRTYESIAGQRRRDIWLRQTFNTVENGQTFAEWANTARTTSLIATLDVITPPQSSSSEIHRDLGLRIDHDLIDGTGGFQVLNALIHHISAAFNEGPKAKLPIFDDSEVVRLSPPARVALRAPEKLELKGEGVQIIKPPASQIENARIPILNMKPGGVNTGRPRFLRRTLSAQQSVKLIKACKAAGASPAHATHTAMAMAVRDFHGQVHPGSEGKQVQYYGTVLRNERARCTPPYNTSAHSATLYFSFYSRGLTIAMPSLILKTGKERNAQFSRYLQETTDFYAQVKDDKLQAAASPFIFAKMTPKLTFPTTADDPLEWRRLNPLPVKDPKEGGTAWLSSLGVLDRIVDRQVGRIRVEDPWLMSVCLNSGLSIFLATYKGKLGTVLVYNDTWHTEEEAEWWLNRCLEIQLGWADGFEETEYDGQKNYLDMLRLRLYN
ncbi:hypothetical protein QBC38DRAFT_525150 [Podospora fimiseda]|uniref:Uncharacterized protein n=1 Tax=Podospora fimiseda TaxID=252190 RepID=A0AAN6YL34_9PEZI|nr:hypothetical protein QBC38DRAFT_525150 [Podospora fimiseda]